MDKKNKRIKFITSLVFCMALHLIASASGAPPAPSQFSGIVTLDGSPAPVDTIISAWINGTHYPTDYTVSSAGQYGLMSVEGDDLATSGVIEGGAEGDNVVFKVNSLQASQTGVWRSGVSQTLDLSATTTTTSTSTVVTTTTTSTTTTTLVVVNLSFDVGNDTFSPWEWSHSGVGNVSEKTDSFADKLNYILGRGCDCSGCYTTGFDCVIPLVFKSDAAGYLTASDLNLTYYSLNTVASNNYGGYFRRSSGGCWVIEHLGGVSDVIQIPFGYNCGSMVFNYTNSSHSHPNTDDAVDDAVYRLLNETLDLDGNGVMDIQFNNESMRFWVDGDIGVQSMWGPATLKLIVWI